MKLVVIFIMHSIRIKDFEFEVFFYLYLYKIQKYFISNFICFIYNLSKNIEIINSNQS